jgi:host factor-I protein
MLQAINLQNEYLEHLQLEQKSVAIYLINGIKLSGLISAFDEYVVLLKDNKSTVDQLIYKHAISTIVPAKSSSSD